MSGSIPRFHQKFFIGALLTNFLWLDKIFTNFYNNSRIGQKVHDTLSEWRRLDNKETKPLYRLNKDFMKNNRKNKGKVRFQKIPFFQLFNYFKF